MDVATALALSVPPSLAISFAVVYAAWKVDVALRDAGAKVISAQKWMNDGLAELGGHFSEAADSLARAHIDAAKYASGWKKQKAPKPPTDDELSVYDLWMRDGGGSRVDERVQLRVEWAMGRIAGTETGQGTIEKAEAILMADAPGYLAALRQRLAKPPIEG